MVSQSHPKTTRTTRAGLPATSNEAAEPKPRLTDRDSRNQEGGRREQAHKIQNQLGVRRPRLPALPREDIKIVIRPRDGLNTSRVSYAQLCDGVLHAAAVSTERVSDDIFRLQPGQNILVVSTPTMENAKKYCSIKEIQVGSQTYATTAYVTPPDDTSKGVIHNIPNYDTQEELTKSLVNSKNPAILQARRMGKTRSVIIVFEGTKVPHYVYYPRWRNIDASCTRRRWKSATPAVVSGIARTSAPDQTKHTARAAGLKTHRKITLAIQHAPFAAKRTSQATKNVAIVSRHRTCSSNGNGQHQQRSRQEDGGRTSFRDSPRGKSPEQSYEQARPHQRQRIRPKRALQFLSPALSPRRSGKAELQAPSISVEVKDQEGFKAGPIAVLL
ncbi:hypothetical protein HPB48_005314 [Haemaphysalis longicornis]|uniref:Uncharacterized protein n=1 Tax=Haemaphysalis longicornis TaxID=44386 RepID=A0A9J6GF35_HAELO|nr:hypothetical protein HPB48_005314 [Haemaphysalis longicornis]